MKDTEFAYAVARVRSNENKLISSASVESLINSSDYKETLKTLVDLGYEGIDTRDEESVLSDITERAFELIYSSAPDKKCLDFLIVKNDFHNIKAILKCMVTDKSSDLYLLNPSVVDVNDLKTALDTKDFSILPEFISGTVKEAYELLTTTMDGQKLEIFLDKKSLEASILLAHDSKDDFSVSLANLMCLIADIKIALRCIKTNKDAEFLADSVACCSGLDLNKLSECVALGIDSLCEYVRNLGYGKLSESIVKGYASFEKACDDLIMEKIRDAKYQCLGIAPLVAYYFAVDAEVKTVRIILSCKKNGIDVDSIRERVRVLYV